MAAMQVQDQIAKRQVTVSLQSGQRFGFRWTGPYRKRAETQVATSGGATGCWFLRFEGT